MLCLNYRLIYFCDWQLMTDAAQDGYKVFFQEKGEVPYSCSELLQTAKTKNTDHHEMTACSWPHTSYMVLNADMALLTAVVGTCPLSYLFCKSI